MNAAAAPALVLPLLSFALGLTGAACAGPAAGTHVETLAIPAASGTAPPTLGPPEPRRAKPPANVPPELQQWVGTWVQPSTAHKMHVTIAVQHGRPTVTRTKGSVSREPYEVRTSIWQDGTLEWSHYVPSTQYTVTYVCTDVVDDALVCSWSNDHQASGKENLPRVTEGAPPPVEDDDP